MNKRICVLLVIIMITIQPILIYADLEDKRSEYLEEQRGGSSITVGKVLYQLTSSLITTSVLSIGWAFTIFAIGTLGGNMMPTDSDKLMESVYIMGCITFPIVISRVIIEECQKLFK